MVYLVLARQCQLLLKKYINMIAIAARIKYAAHLPFQPIRISDDWI